MNWPDALELVASRTGHARYRELCAEGYPDAETRDGYRRLVVALATGDPPDPGPTPEDLALREHVEKRGGCCP